MGGGVGRVRWRGYSNGNFGDGRVRKYSPRAWRGCTVCIFKKMGGVHYVLKKNEIDVAEIGGLR